MGHIDLRVLPATAPWQRVLGLLGTATPDPADVAFATATAAQDRLLRLRGDPNLVFCVWLLVRLASAARRPDFDQALRHLGIDPRRSSSLVGFLTQISACVRSELEQQPGSGPFGDLAVRALTCTLTDTVGQQSTLLFGSTLDDVADAFARISTPTHLGRVIARFFGEFLGLVLRFYVDRALPLQIGPGASFSSIHESEVFVADLTTYARTVASVTETFASEWFDRHQWLTDGAISREETTGFVAHALEKLEAGVLRLEAVA